MFLKLEKNCFQSKHERFKTWICIQAWTPYHSNMSRLWRINAKENMRWRSKQLIIKLSFYVTETQWSRKTASIVDTLRNLKINMAPTAWDAGI